MVGKVVYEMKFIVMLIIKYEIGFFFKDLMEWFSLKKEGYSM